MITIFSFKCEHILNNAVKGSLICSKTENIIPISCSYNSSVKFLILNIINFDLELQNPSMKHEQEKLEMLNQQIEAAEKAMETKLFSRQWVYENIFDFSEDKKVEIYEGIVDDTKQKFRFCLLYTSDAADE